MCVSFQVQVDIYFFFLWRLPIRFFNSEIAYFNLYFTVRLIYSLIIFIYFSSYVVSFLLLINFQKDQTINVKHKTNVFFRVSASSYSFQVSLLLCVCVFLFFLFDFSFFLSLFRSHSDFFFLLCCLLLFRLFVVFFFSSVYLISFLS